MVGLELTQGLIAAKSEWHIPEMNRALVEGATHPELIERMLATKGDQWQRYHQRLGGTEAAARMVAKLSKLDRRTPFDASLRFPKSDERILTRLGEEGVVLPLDPPPIGPFGCSISRIALPAHWSRGVSNEDAVAISEGELGLDFAVAGKRFRYARSGLQDAQDSPPLSGVAHG